MIIGIDFDGTCVRHEYPQVGKDAGRCVEILSKLVNNGHLLILFTMRDGKELQDAVDWFTAREIPLYGVNTNPDQHVWTSSPKAYAHLYIDDAAINCPLMQDHKMEPHIDGLLYLNGEKPDYNKQSKITPIGRPFVDWEKIDIILIEKGLYK